jgi:hypothetical protein
MRRPWVSELEDTDSATLMDPVLRLTALSETDAEPWCETDAKPVGLSRAATDWDGALTDQPP